MGLRRFFRRLFKIPNREFRALFQRYAASEKDLERHIARMEPYSPIKGSVSYQRGTTQPARKVALYTPYTQEIDVPEQNDSGDDDKKMGISKELYNSILVLCQRAEELFNTGEVSAAKAIMDGLEEIQLPQNAIQDCVKKLQSKIK